MKKKTDSNELKKLSRIDLLEILVKQEEEIERLKAELADTESKLADAEDRLQERSMQLQEAGSIAEAALKVSGVFEAAQEAADRYLEEIGKLRIKQQTEYEEKAAECTAQIKKMLKETAEFCERKKAQALDETEDRNNTDKSGADYDSVSFWADLF